MTARGRKVTCSRGHVFYKSSDCPVCPKCWAGYYREKHQSDFPEKLGAPALRALLHAKIKNLKALANYSEKDLLAMHGMGPKGVRMLKAAMKKQDLHFSV